MRPRHSPLLILVIALSLGAAFVHAQTAHWEPSGGTLAYGQASEIQLVFENCAPKGDPALPRIDGLSLQRTGQSSQTSIINGSMTRSETLAYAVRPTQRTTVTLPEFSVDTDKGRISVPSVSYDVGDATVGQSSVPLDKVASSRLTAPVDVWAGEVFTFNYTLNVGRRYYYSVGSNFPEWSPDPLVVEEWAKPEIGEATINGDSRIVISYKTRALLRAPGAATVKAATQLVNITTGNTGMGFFSRPNLEQYAITSTRPTINVRPLPTGAPASFNGAVGSFTLKSNVVPATAGVGEPITWTLTLAGTGNWPDIAGLPAREVSKDFRTVQPQAKRTPKEGALFDATLIEDVVLIPSRAGTYTLGPVTWSYFDPAKGEYRTITTDKTTVTITGAPAPITSASTTTAASPGAARPADNAPAKPGAIPRDPLPDRDSALTPLTPAALTAALLSPGVALLAFWLWLALRRARQTDPLRPRREARNRISITLASLRTTKDPARIAPLLLAWQKDSAILWQLPQAVPGAASLPPGETRWATLWAEADRTLYRADSPLPADWTSRAEAALAGQPLPPFSALQLFRLPNLFPFAALFALALLLPAPAARAADGAAAYARGDFAAAEQAWRDTLAQEPVNPAAHYDLSLALAQQDRWGEAAAQAGVAFAQQPREPAVFWNLGFMMEHAGFAPSVFTGFARSNPPHLLARQLSSPQWQVVLFLSAVLAALGGGVWLLRFYGARQPWLKITAAVLLGVGTVLAAISAFSLRVYSPVDDMRSAIVWRTTTLRSIPTEADTTQKTTALSAGTVALVDKTFLGWTRLAFPNGQTGWVRQEDLVRVWR